MEAIKNLLEQTIPPSTEEFKVKSITINIENRVVTLKAYKKEDGTFKSFAPFADVSDEWDKASTLNKTIIRAFFKRLVAICLEVNNTDITGDAL